MKILEIDQKIKTLVKSERKITYEILLLIQVLDLTRSYTELGYSSLFEYLHKEIGYSEGATQRRIAAARFIKQCPDLEADIQQGKINLSQIALASTALKQEEEKTNTKISADRKIKIIQSLKLKNTFETKKALKEELPHFELPLSKVTPANNHKIHVTLEFEEAEWKQVQSLLARMSHKVPSQKLEKLLLYWQEQLEKKLVKTTKIVSKDSKNVYTGNDLKNSEKVSNKQDIQQEVSSEAKTDAVKSQINCSPFSVLQISPPKRRYRKYISVEIQRKLQQRSQNRCEFVSKITGRRCGSKHFLEIDHKIPIALRGDNNFKNLRTYCRSHNQLLAKKWHLSKAFNEISLRHPNDPRTSS